MSSPTLSDALRRYLLVDRAQQTRDTYRRFLTRFVTDIGPARPLDLIRAEDIDAYVTAMRTQRTKYDSHPSRPVETAPLASTTVYKNVKMIKSFFHWCEKEDLITESPAGYLVNRRPRRPLGQGKAATDDELDLILAVVRFKLRDYALVMLLAQSGCRAGETAGLRLRDLDLDGLSALVDGKGDVRRRIYFDEDTADALRAWLARRPRVTHDHVFVSTRGQGAMTAAGVSNVIRRACKTAEIRELGAHSLRHRVGLKFARARVSPRVAQYYLGHSNVRTTLDYYQDIDETDLRLAGSLLSQRGEWPEQAKQKPASKRLKPAIGGG